ncbi:MAG TPA: amine dehydrogenase large subunit [Chthoniobacterales bacterium]|nr:amine dehydrogenase large subunit [Chthoniobacterales bacterium]
MKTLSLIAVSLAIASTAVAQKVSVKKGNILFTDKAGKTIALTSGGKDGDPHLSPDGKLVAFTRKSEAKVATGSVEEATTELWIVSTDGSSARKILEPTASDKMEDTLAYMSAPQFSSDGKKLYFETSAWTTSDAVHVVDLETKQQQFLCDGNALQVVTTGEYKDHLLVSKHKYFVGGGSYDWVWLVAPDGKEVGPVGENTKNFKELYTQNSCDPSDGVTTSGVWLDSAP